MIIKIFDSLFPRSISLCDLDAMKNIMTVANVDNPKAIFNRKCTLNVCGNSVGRKNTAAK